MKKHLIEYFIMLIIDFAVTGILSIIFKRNGFSFWFFIFVLVSVITKTIYVLIERKINIKKEIEGK